MIIDSLKVGNLRCNCYLLKIENEILIIDPGADANKIIEKIGDGRVVGIIITHHHPDHDGAVYELVERYKTLVYDKNNLIEGKFKIGKFNFEVIFTPGHKEDSITLFFGKEKAMFCGDFIFKDCIGRCDLEGGSITDMILSIKKIKKYDMDIVIYPGHGVTTTLRHEINNNIYFRDDISYF